MGWPLPLAVASTGIAVDLIYDGKGTGDRISIGMTALFVLTAALSWLLFLAAHLYKSRVDFRADGVDEGRVEVASGVYLYYWRFPQGGALAVRSAGDESRRAARPPVLFLGGTGFDLRSPVVAKQAGSLARRLGWHGSRPGSPYAGTPRELVVFDMRGQGRSDVGESALYSMQMYARDAATLMAKLGHKQFDVIGYSFGGMVAQQLCLDAPSAVRRCCLAACTSGGAGGSSTPMHEVVMPSGGAVYEQGQLSNEQSVAATRQYLSINLPIPAILAGYAARLINALDAEPMRGHPSDSVARRKEARHGCRLQLEARSQHDCWERLGKLSLPCLVLCEASDQVAPVENCKKLHARIPGAKLRCYDEGAAHVFFMSSVEAQQHAADFVTLELQELGYKEEARQAMVERAAAGEVEDASEAVAARARRQKLESFAL